MKKISLFLAALSLAIPGYGVVFTVQSGANLTTPIIVPPGVAGLLIERGATVSTAATAITINTDNQFATNLGMILTSGANADGIDNSGDNVTLLNGGLISTSGTGARGIDNEGDFVVITNTGLITTLEENADGIDNGGNNVAITNAGAITTSADRAEGIQNQGFSVVIINSGSISTFGENAEGIFSDGFDNTVTNTGLITTFGDNSAAMDNGGIDSTLINSGVLATFGENARGMETSARNTVMTNSGSITTTGDEADGIGVLADDSGTIVTNSGFISTSGADAAGIFVESTYTNARVINSGTIRSEQSFALNLAGNSTTLTLLRGSNLQGPVFAGSNFSLNVETGLNLALTLDSSGDTFSNLGISAPFVRQGNTVAVIDPTGFAMQADALADLSDTILDNIYRNRLGCCDPCSCGLWVQGIGSYRSRSRDGDYVGYNNWQGGLLLGYGRPLCQGTVDLFAGFTCGEATVDQHTQKADLHNYFVGLTYETCVCDTFVGFALAAGYLDWENTRYVMNNLASGGVDKARADIQGAFVSPELTLAHQFCSLWCQPIASFTFRYAGFFPGSYHENGSVADLAVKDRQIDLLTTRFEVATPISQQCGCFCWSVEPYIGVFGRYQVGGTDVCATLLDQSIHFDQEGPRNLGALLLGFRGIQSFDCFNLFLNVEASFDNASSTRFLGEGGIGWNF